MAGCELGITFQSPCGVLVDCDQALEEYSDRLGMFPSPCGVLVDCDFSGSFTDAQLAKQFPSPCGVLVDCDQRSIAPRAKSSGRSSFHPLAGC